MLSHEYMQVETSKNNVCISVSMFISLRGIFRSGFIIPCVSVDIYLRRYTFKLCVHLHRRVLVGPSHRVSWSFRLILFVSRFLTPYSMHAQILYKVVGLCVGLCVWGGTQTNLDCQRKGWRDNIFKRAGSDVTEASPSMMNCMHRFLISHHCF